VQPNFKELWGQFTYLRGSENPFSDNPLRAASAEQERDVRTHQRRRFVKGACPVLTSSAQVSKPAGAKDQPKALPSATAAKTTLHNPIRQTPSPINLAACQEACDVRRAFP
jgi:hypothetical protein